MDQRSRPYGQTEAAGEITASTTAALDGTGTLGSLVQFLPYYFVAVAAGVTVWWLTKQLGKKSKKGDR